MSGQTESAFGYIKEKILNGTYYPSQKLTESQLAEEVGVSRVTIKKALIMLERENLVTVESNKGAMVRTFSLEEIKNYMEIRELLEGLVAKSAAANMLQPRLDKLGKILSKMDSLLKENHFDDYSLLNREFHKIIYDSSGNVQAVELINTIKSQLNRIHFRTILVPGRNHDSFNEHKRILEALQARDEKGTEEAVKNHIANVRRVITENYQYLL